MNGDLLSICQSATTCIEKLLKIFRLLLQMGIILPTQISDGGLCRAQIHLVIAIRNSSITFYG